MKTHLHDNDASNPMQNDVIRALERLCRKYGLPISRIRKATKALLEEDFDSQTFGLEGLRRKTTIPLWNERGGEDRRLEAPRFIEKYYHKEIEQRILTQSYIRQCDFSLYQAFHAWRHKVKKSGCSDDDLCNLIGFDFPKSMAKATQVNESTPKPSESLNQNLARPPQKRSPNLDGNRG